MLEKYEDLRKVNLESYIHKRDGADYINWATIVDLLHQHGAEKVYFEPVVNEQTGSSLFYTNKEFTDAKGNTNRVYETAIKIVIDDLEFIQRGPVMNGANPVKDNSMSQQRLWNCQTRLFAKGVAIRTGLGFGLWLEEENANEENSIEDDLSKHDILKVKERVQELYTKIYKSGISTADIAKKLNKTEDEVKALFSNYDTLNTFEKDLQGILNDKK